MILRTKKIAAGLATAAMLSLAGALGAQAQDKTDITFSYLWGGAEGQALE